MDKGAGEDAAMLFFEHSLLSSWWSVLGTQFATSSGSGSKDLPPGTWREEMKHTHVDLHDFINIFH